MYPGGVVDKGLLNKDDMVFVDFMVEGSGFGGLGGLVGVIGAVGLGAVGAIAD